MKKNWIIKISIIILVFLILIPILYLAYDRSLMPLPPDWESPPYTPGQSWEDYAQEFLSKSITPNALEHYLNAFSLYTQVSGSYDDDQIIRYGWPQNNPDAEQCLRLNQKTLEEMRLATRMNHCEFPPMLCSMNAPRFPFLKFSILARLLAVQGRKFESQNQYNKALDCYLDNLIFCKDMAQKDQEVMMSLSYSYMGMNTYLINELMSKTKLTESDLSKIIDVSRNIEKEQPNLANVLEIRRRCSYTVLYRATNTPMQSAQRVYYPTYNPIIFTPPFYYQTIQKMKANAFAGYIFFNRGRILRNNLNLYTELLDAITTKSYREFMQINWESKTPKDLINKYTIPYFSRIYTMNIRVTESLRMIQIQSAIDLYHLKNKKYPKFLEDLIPDYFSTIPLDPYVDQPFHYTKDSTCVFIYSVGPDFKDDKLEILYDPTNGITSPGDIR